MGEDGGVERDSKCKSCTLWLPCPTIEAIDRKAREDGVSPAEVVAAAIRAYIGDENAGCCR